MDFLNELFGSEMGELKRHQKVTFSISNRGLQATFDNTTSYLSRSSYLDRGRNQKVFNKRGIHRA